MRSVVLDVASFQETLSVHEIEGTYCLSAFRPVDLRSAYAVQPQSSVSPPGQG